MILRVPEKDIDGFGIKSDVFHFDVEEPIGLNGYVNTLRLVVKNIT